MKSNTEPSNSTLSYQPANKYPSFVGMLGYTSPTSSEINCDSISSLPSFVSNETVNTPSTPNSVTSYLESSH